MIGDDWNFGSGIWQFVESPFFAWNPQRSGPSESPWTSKDAIFPGKIDGRDAHDFFGVTDSLKLKFVITLIPPTDDVNHLNLQGQLLLTEPHPHRAIALQRPFEAALFPSVLFSSTIQSRSC